MATGVPPDDMQAFYQFLGRRLEGSGDDLTPEQSVREFRNYQEELQRLREHLATAEQQSARGESSELDIDAVLQRVRQRLTAEGITE